MKKNLFLVLSLLTVSLLSYAQPYETYDVIGEWEDNLVWDGNIPPATDNINGDVTINGRITRNGSVNFFLGSDLLVTDTLIITGDIIAAFGSTIDVADDGLLIVLGDLLGVVSWTDVVGDIVVVGEVFLENLFFGDPLIVDPLGNAYFYDDTPYVSPGYTGTIQDETGMPSDLSDIVNGLINTYTCSVAPTTASADNDNYCDGAVTSVTLSYSGGLRGTRAIARWYDGDPLSGGVAIGRDQGYVVNPAPTTDKTYYVRFEGDPASCHGGGAADTVTAAVSVAVTVVSTPAAAGSITGTATVCQGQTGVTYSVPAITDATGYTWSLPTGASITSGSNTNSITVSYNNTASSGNVTVQGTNGCGSGTISSNYVVTVNPLPAAAGSITGTATVCQGQTGVTYSVPAITDATGYTWSLPTGASITSGSNTNSITVSYNNTASSGNVTVQGTNGCGSGTISSNYAVTVNPLPAAAGSITGTATVCQGQTGVTYSVPAITDATGYTWSLPTGASITSGSNTNSITVSYNNTASSGNVTVQGTNGCGSGTISSNYAVTVNPLPAAAGSITGTATVCQGQTGVTYSVPAITDATGYTWNLPTGASITSGSNTNSITVSYNNTASSGNVTVQGTNGCGSGTLSSNYAVTVNPLPAAAGSITGTATVCQGQTGVTYSVPAITDATGYTWSLPTGASITSGSNTNSITVSYNNTASSGNVTVQGTNGCGSGTLSSNYAVTVNPLPAAAGSITGTATVCQGQTGVTYSVPAITDATGYTWSLPTGASITSGSNTNSITVSYNNTASSGNVTVQGTNGCGSGTLSSNYAVTVNPLPAAAGSITGTATVCQGQTGVTYSVPAITDATGYKWSLPTGASITSGSNTNSITVSYNNTASSGNVTVQGTNGCGSGTISSNYVVTVNPLPAAAGSITGTATVCQGQTGVTYSVPAITDATGYTWSLPTGASITSGSNTNSITVSYNNTASSGNVTVQGTNGCGSGTISSNYAVTVNPLPAAAGSITGTATVCQGQTGVTYSVPAITDATGYTWSLPTGASITSGSNTNSITVSYNNTASSGNVTVQGTNGCGSGTISSNYVVTVNPLPAAAGSITGTATVCQGQTGVTYSVPAITDATGYTWSLPTGASITSGSNTNSITVSYNNTASSGNVTVQGTNGCGSGTISSNYAVTVNPLPAAAGSITGTATVCQGQTGVTYSVPAITDATGYTWSLPTGASITSGSNTNSITVSYNNTASSGNVTVQGTNGCGSGTISSNYAVTVNPLPAAAGSITGTATVCQGQTGVTYSVPAITDATGYTWSLPTGASITSGSNTNSITVSYNNTASSGNVTVQGTNGCGSGTISSNYAVTVNPLPAAAGSITGTATVCQGQTGVTYSVPAITDATGYTWNLPTGASITSGSNTNSITVSYNNTASSGNVTVQGTNGCGSGTLSSNYAVTVNPLPAAAGSITGTATVCQGQTGVTYSVPAITDATGYTWSLPTGASITSGSNTNSITVSYNNTASSGNVTVQGTNGCGSGTLSSNYAVTVNPLPAAAGSITGTATVCQGQTGVTYSVPAITDATGYTWNLPTGASITSGSNTNSITVSYNNTASSGNVTVQGTNGCGSGTLSSNYAVTVNPLPAAAGSITGTATVCQGQTGVTYSVPAITDATGYTWSLPTGASITSGSNTNSITVSYNNTASSGNVTVQGTNGCGSGTLSSNYAVTVNPLPAAAGSITGTATVCQGQTGVTYSVPAITDATGYTWSLPTGASITSGSNTNSITVSYNNTASSGNVTVQGTNGCGSGTLSSNYAVTVNPLPAAAGSITGTATVCQGQTGVTYSVPAITDATGYTWSLPTGASITSGSNTNSITVSYNNTASSGNVTVQGTNGCGSGTLSSNYAVTVNPLPAAAGSITGTATVCQGQTGVTYSVPAITDATGYTWSLPTGASITSGSNTNSITVSYNNTASSGNVTVQGTNGCGSGTISSNYAVTVNPLPAAAGSITGTATVCQGQTGVTYSVPAITDATGYTWSLPTGASITSGSNTNSITVSYNNTASSGNVTVQGTNGCGSGTISSNYAVQVSAVSATSVTPSGTSLCGGSDGQLIVNGENGAIGGYEYSIDGGSVYSSTNPITGLSAGSYDVWIRDASLTSCATQVDGLVTISDPGGPSSSMLTGTANICNGSSTSLFVNITGGVGPYTVTLSDGTIATNYWSGNNINVSPTTTTVYTIFALTDASGCGSSAITGTATVSVSNPTATTATPTNTTTCSGADGQITISGMSGAVSGNYAFSTDGGTTYTTSNPVTGLSAGTYDVWVRDADNTSCESQVDAAVVVSDPTGPSSAVLAGTATICSGSSTNLTVAITGGASPYTVDLSDGTTVAAYTSGSNIEVSPVTATTYTITTVTDNNGCTTGSNSGTATVTVSNASATTATATGTTTCSGSDGQITIGGMSGAISGNYEFSTDGGTTYTTSNPVTGLGAGTYDVWVRDADNTSCESQVDAAVVVSDPTGPSAAVVAGTATICSGSSTNLTVAITGGASPYTVDLSDGTTAAAYTSGSNIAVSPAVTTAYTITSVTDNNGCTSGSNTGTATVTVEPGAPEDAGAITGTEDVCQGDNSITYRISAITDAETYIWNYTGQGATINGSGNSISIDFANDATIGDLTVYAENGCGTGTSSDAYSININNVPTAAGIITGEESVCPGDVSVRYSIDGVQGADEYIWEFTDLSVAINGSTNSITIDFYPGAASGTLTVYGENNCGAGNTSPDFDVTVLTDQECQEEVLEDITNSFTPDGDGINETWIINGIEAYPEAKIEVFDRWGRRVFFIDGNYSESNAWDGRHNGKVVPYDNYFYTIDLYGDGKEIRKGNLTIVK